MRRAHNVLHRALEQALRWDWLAINPASRASLPRLPGSRIRSPSPEEIHRLVDAATGETPALGVYLRLAAATGARRGELVGLRWPDVRFDEGAIVVSRSVVVGPAGATEKDTKTHAARRVAADGGTIDVLRAHLAAGQVKAESCGTTLAADGFVFSDAVDASVGWRPEYATQAFARIARRAGVEHVRLHDLRHFVASRLLAGGIDVRTVAGRLGHRNPNVTLNVYAHFLPEADRGAADVLGSLLD
ncbi:MAG: tyrosine-type recombinase/integrase [Acidimicrobiales bacterium]